MRGQILRGDNIFTLTATFSRVMCAFIRADVFPTPSVEQSAMVSGHGRGVVIAIVILEEMAHLEDMDPMVAGIMALIRGPINVNIARGIIISQKCWEKFGHPE